MYVRLGTSQEAPSGVLVGRFRVSFQGRVMAQPCTWDLSLYPRAAATLTQPPRAHELPPGGCWETAGPESGNWMSSHEIPSPVP